MLTMKYSFIVSVLLFGVVMIEIPSKALHPPQHLLELIMSALALSNLVLGLNARRLFARLTPANASSSLSATPMARWFSARIFSLAMMESCALFALVLHMLGSSSRLVGILFACALITLFIWTPGASPTSELPGRRLG
jgi:hypothetical protein